MKKLMCLFIFVAGCSTTEINYNIPTDSEITYIYNTINKEAFDNKLSAKLNVDRENKKPRILGETYYKRNPPLIIINARAHICEKDKFNNLLWQTIAHEMAHVVIDSDVEKDHHGPLWRKEYERICSSCGIKP